MDMPTNIVDDFSGEDSSKQRNMDSNQNIEQSDEPDEDTHRTTVIDLSSEED